MSGLSRSQAGRTRATRIADGERLAEQKVSVLAEAQRERVGGVVDEDVFPQPDRLARAAGRERLDGGQMQPLARRSAADRRFRCAERAGNLCMIATKATDHEETGDRRRAERKGRILRQGALQNPDRIAAERKIVGDRAVEGFRRSGRTGER